jgi:hypothetical protein
MHGPCSAARKSQPVLKKELTMTAMQKFYQTHIAADQPTAFGLLAKADPGDVLAEDFLGWESWG